MTSDDIRFTEDFPAATYEAWLAEVDKALKGAPFEKRMLHRGYEGITVKPLYTRQDWGGEGEPAGLPGRMPFTRGGHAAGGSVKGWDIRQCHRQPDPQTANTQILTDLSRGVTSVELRLDAAARSGLDANSADAADITGKDGIMVYSADDLDHVLKDVVLDKTPIALEAEGQFLTAAALLMALWRRRGTKPEAARGAFNADPLGTLASTGRLPVAIDQALAELADLAQFTARTYPNVTAVRVDTRAYHGAGASETEDLACALATGVAYLRAMTGAGLDIDAACRQIAFCLPLSCDQFTSIAKLRAARRLWARVAEASGASEPARATHVQARSDDRMMSQRDPWVNMLRCTVSCFAAAVGGADSVTIQPFDAALGLPDDFSLRMARNTQIVLQEESHLNQVIDAAGGSWYVESLTDEMAKAAWSLFQEIEKAGGMAAALQDGSVAARIETVQATRVKNLGRRRDALTGVSEFPNIHEEPVAHEQPDAAALRTQAAQRLASGPTAEAKAALDALSSRATGGGALSEAAVEAASAGATLGGMAARLAGTPAVVKPLPLHRLPADFEALRDASDGFRDRTGARPKIFLANLGPIAKHTIRATFAKNYFEAGGIEAVSSPGFQDGPSCAAAFKDSGARIAILCSIDPIYESMVDSVAPALKQAGCEYLFLAGNPGEKKDAYMAAGVDDFIFLGGEVLGTLRKTSRLLGVID